MIDTHIEKMLSQFGDGLIAEDFAACHKLLTPARKKQMTVTQLEAELGPEARHKFGCEIMGVNPDEEERLPDPVKYEIDGFPYRDAPEDVDKDSGRGWFSLQLQPDEDTGYDVCGEIGIFVQVVDGSPRIERFELVEPD